MNRTSRSEKILGKWLVFLLSLALPVLAWGQHRSSAPAPHASAPSHASAPAHAAPSHAAPSHTAPSSRPANSRPMGGQAGRTNPSAGHSNSTMGRGNTTAGRSNMPGHTNTTAGRGNTTAGRGNTNAGHTNTNAGRNNSMAGHNNANAGRNNANASRNNASAHANAGRAGGHTPPGRNVSLRGGGSAHLRPNGQIRSVNKNGMHIEHGMHGGRTVVSTHNGARVVTNGRHGGYVQRAYVNRGGHSYYSRTYYHNGVYSVGVYRGYYYGGYPYYGYYPGYYYAPAYYGWAYNPWPAPVAWGWGWGGAPWYGYYGAYYQPYPVYPAAAFWLTDYLLAANLQAAYAAQAEAAEGWMYHDASDGTLLASLLAVAPAPEETAKLSPDVKKELAEEVKLILALEQSEAGKSGSSSSGGQTTSNEAPPALDPKFKTFVVSTDTSLVADGGDECALSNGDVIERTTETPDADRNVNVKVVASTKSDCAIGKEGPIAVDDLQEMYNHFREQLKDGMGELAKKQGTGGLPKAPDTSTKSGDVPPPQPDKSAEKTLQDQQASADQAEGEVKQEAGSGSGGGQQ